MSPSLVPDHNIAGLTLAMQLHPQLPEHLEVIPDVDVGQRWRHRRLHQLL